MDCILLLDTFGHLLPGGNLTKFGDRQGHNIAQLAILDPKHPINVQNFQLIGVAVGYDPINFARDEIFTLKFSPEGISVTERT